MSAGYASRLKEYPNKGVCGLPELRDTKRALGLKIKILCSWLGNDDNNDNTNSEDSSSPPKMKKRPKVVVLTGAGISTAAGIPDFRGPKGIWTVEEKARKAAKRVARQEAKSNKKQKQQSSSKNETENGTSNKSGETPSIMDFSLAQPTLTHRAISFLVQKGIVDFCITQNVDGLHKRSGLPRAKHAVLHGCAFTEKCEDCRTEYFRDYDVGGMSFQKTGRYCTQCTTNQKGGGALRDTLLDWEDPLPEDDFVRSQWECSAADVCICLGTSLRIEPAGGLPTRARKFCIVNLQETPYDKQADLIIRAKVDDVMTALLEHLNFGEWQKETPPEIERIYSPPPKEESDEEEDG